MVYIRSKTVKGTEYAYLVCSVWDQKAKTSKQQTIKYLGKVSGVTSQNIPLEYRNDPKIMVFLSSHNTKDKDKTEKLLVKIRKEIFHSLTEGDQDRILKIYDAYIKSSSISNFYENLLKIVMYEIGNLWEKNKLNTAMEHVASNTAHGLVNLINEKTLTSPTKCKILICTPEGEWHNLGCKIIESVLKSNGNKVFNMSPSAPHDSILGYVQNIEPDVIIISVTLKENITSCQRLIKKIRTKSSIPILVGGQALKNTENAKIDAIVIENDSLGEISKSIRSLRK